MLAWFGEMTFNFDIIVNTFPNIITIIVLLYLTNRTLIRDASYKKSLSLMFISLASLSAIWLLEKFAYTVELSLFLIYLEYITIGTLALMTLVFVLQYLGIESWLTTKRIGLLVGIVLSLILIIITNPWHELYYTSVELLESGGLYYLRAEYGPAFILNPIIIYGILAACILLLNRAVIQSPYSHKWGPLTILLAIVAIIITSLIYTTSARDNPLMDQYSLGIMISALILFIGEKNSKFIGHEIITVQDAIQSTEDGFIITNIHNEPIYMNRQAENILKSQSSNILSSEIDMLKMDTGMEIIIKNGDRQQFFDVSHTPMKRGDRTIGFSYIIHDITNLKITEHELRHSKEKNHTLSRIIEHDIKNELTALLGYLELARDADDLDQHNRMLDKTSERAYNVVNHLDFAHIYRLIGSEEPFFQKLESAISEGFSDSGLDKLQVNVDVGNYSILADPMLSRVFYNLVSNTIKHAKGASRICVNAFEEEGYLNIDYSDDGPGLTPEMKSNIFNSSSPLRKNHGMVIVQEILHITDIIISEHGEKGALFTISVPPGKWRV